MKRSRIHGMLALALLAALAPPATADDVWLTDHEVTVPNQWTYVATDSAAPTDTSETIATDILPPAQGSTPAITSNSGTTPIVSPPDDSWRVADSLCSDASGDCEAKPTYYFDGEVMALRAHFGETAVGKLAEKYEASERLTVGVENAWGAGGRIRYWSYDRATPLLPGSGDSIRFDFDVVDFEGTTRFTTERFDLLLAGGLRLADIKIDTGGGRSRNDMPGGTMAADLRTMVCYDCNYNLEWRSIMAARLSIFGGDWEGSANGLITPTRDDNITVVEIYGGVECAREWHGHVLYARLLFESQNWRSDALGRDTGQDSLSFIGPGLSLGMIY